MPKKIIRNLFYSVSIILILIAPLNLANTPSYGSVTDFRVGSVGDWSCNANAIQTALNIQNRNMDVVLGLGDFSYQNTADCWFNVISGIDEQMHIAIGNHDDETSALLDQYMSHFGLTNQFYSFDYQNMHFLSVSTELPITVDSEQYVFVQDDLEQASQNASINWIVVFMHKPMYTSPTLHPASTEYRNALHPLFNQYGVDLVFQGHNHNYQRTYPLLFNPTNPSSPLVVSANPKTYTNPSAPIFLLVGTGGHSSYPLNGQPSYVVKQFNNTFGFMGFNVTNGGMTLEAAFYSNTGSSAGAIRDSFTISKDPNASSNHQRKTDFNGDGFEDLAIGAPGEDFGSKIDAGIVNVLYGSSTGLSATSPKADQIWHQDSSNVEGGNEAGDSFGSALATGDFNGDGYSDLAVGVSGEDLGSSADAGGVNVIYGSSAGLSATGASGTGRADQFWSQDVSGIEDVVEAGDQFGASLASGDFNNDGFDDLAVGVPLENVGSTADSGAVNVIFGSSLGLSATIVADQFWHQDSSNIEDVSEVGDHLGRSLEVSDFNNDGFDDVVISSPDEDVGTFVDAGAINVIYGSSTGLSATVILDQLWTQDSAEIEGDPTSSDHFGQSLAAGDFNADGYMDIGIGVPYKGNATAPSYGILNVVYGSAIGLSASGTSGTGRDDQIWYQDSINVLGSAEGGDNFGYAVGAGDLDADGYWDLAIGVPGDNVGSISVAGAINIIHGSVTGLSDLDNQLWNQDSAGIKGRSEFDDFFGSSITLGDFNNDGNSDLAVGVPFEYFDDVNDDILAGVGAVNVIYGSSLGLGTPGNQLWQQDSASIEDVAELDDHFGSALP